MKILFVKLGAIGDALMARGLPALAKRLHPDSRLTWVAGRGVAPLVRLFPGVDQVVVADDAALLLGALPQRLGAGLRLASDLGLGRWDLVLTGHADRRYRLLTAFVRAGERRGFGPGFPKPGRFHGDEYARLLHNIDGPAAPAAPLPGLRVALDQGLASRLRGKGPAALLFPGGARNALRDGPLKRWPLRHYAALAKLLLKRGWRVWLGGGAGDAWTREAFQGLKTLDLIGATDLPQTLALCAAAKAVVSHDSGPMHLAQASGAKVIALFGPTPPASFVDPRSDSRVIWGGEELACRPCYDGRDFAPCADNICLGHVAPGRVLRLVLA